jgi:hypothetical protein
MTKLGLRYSNGSEWLLELLVHKNSFPSQQNSIQLTLTRRVVEGLLSIQAKNQPEHGQSGIARKLWIIRGIIGTIRAHLP